MSVAALSMILMIVVSRSWRGYAVLDLKLFGCAGSMRGRWEPEMPRSGEGSVLRVSGLASGGRECFVE